MSKDKAAKKLAKAEAKQRKALLKACNKSLKKALSAEIVSPSLSLDPAQRKEMAEQWVQQVMQTLNSPVVSFYPETPYPLDKPLKKKACKSCPALSGGLCRCAVKQSRKLTPGTEPLQLVNL
ncbi:hypothetical protein [Ferrimonas pelagia]|uniref:Uncharacterized protein n=1 Tax=Ferrimonas pelagia TaxID=1177826 RepID=A0ABP9EK96_9GAMM